jgi:hypothetical protein
VKAALLARLSVLGHTPATAIVNVAREKTHTFLHAVIKRQVVHKTAVANTPPSQSGSKSCAVRRPLQVHMQHHITLIKLDRNRPATPEISGESDPAI